MDFNESRCSQPSQKLHGLQVMAQQNSALLVAAAALRPLSAHLSPLAPPYTRRHAAHYAGPGLSFRRRLAGPGLAARPCLGNSYPIHRTVPSDFCRLCQLVGFFESAVYKLICSSETVAALSLRLSFLLSAFLLVVVDN